MTERVRLALVGLGNVGRAFLELMPGKARLLRERTWKVNHPESGAEPNVYFLV